MINEYWELSNVIIIAFALALVLFLLSFLLILRNPYAEKISPYECGFNPFNDARKRFDVQFYLVSILFIIFDLEITFLFPFVVISNYLNIFGIFILFIFLFILTIGFIYEWLTGALEW